MTARAQTVTILFTDLVSSTELLQRAGDERAQRIFKAHHRLLSEAVQAHGGHEVKWLGDGLMVAFDSARDAARCAIAMQHASRRPAAGERLEIRVGLHVGDAFVDESDYFGTSVVIARRLCDKADAGQIFASDLVVRLLDGRHEIIFEDLGALALKGIEAPVHAHEVRYEHDPLAMLAVTPFVGREDVIAALTKKLDEARAGKGSLVMLVGEPGIGKTRTAEEFCEHARQAGATVLRGRCYDGEWAAPFSPFMEAIREYASSAPPNELTQRLGADAGVLARIVPMLHEQLPDIAEPPSIPAEGERYRLLEAAGDFFARMAAARPLVLMLDDLHWADKGTIAMLRQLARLAPQQALLLVGAYRDIELDRAHPLADALQTLRRETNYERLVLKGLGAADVGVLLNLVAEQDVPEQFAQAIGDETGGNPFFIREMMLHLVEEKKIIQDDGRWAPATTIAEMRIPEGVREVIGRRLSRVSEGCGRMLTVASALTAGFSWEVISALVDVGDAALLDAVEEALAAQLIVERERNSYEFTHALIRHTLYEELSTPRRLLLHRQIGEALERLYTEDIEPHLAELAHHFFESGQAALAKKGVDFASRAAEKAEGLGAHDEASALYERAIQVSELHNVHDTAATCELLLSLGRAQFHAGQFGPENTAVYLKASDLAKRAGLPELCARAASCEGRVWPVSDERLVPVLEEALAALDAADSSVRARALGYLGLLLSDVDKQRARAMTKAGIEMAHRLGDARTEAYVLSWRFLVIDSWDAPYERWVEETNAVVAALIASADAANDPEMRRAAQFTALVRTMYDGDIAAAESHVAEHDALSTRSRIPQDMRVTRSAKTALSLLAGRHDEAERLVEESRPAADVPLVAAQTYLVQLYGLRLQQGRLPEIEGLLRVVRAAEPRARAFAAHFAAETGDLEWARTEFADALDVNLEEDRSPFYSQGLVLLLGPDVCRKLNNKETAAQLYRELLPWRAINFGLGLGVTFYMGSASRQLGMLATTLGQIDDAERHFEDALAMNTRMEARPWLARTQLDYAQMLLKRADAGDGERAHELLAAALATAREIGMAKVASDCEELVKTL